MIKSIESNVIIFKYKVWIMLLFFNVQVFLRKIIHLFRIERKIETASWKKSHNYSDFGLFKPSRTNSKHKISFSVNSIKFSFYFKKIFDCSGGSNSTNRGLYSSSNSNNSCKWGNSASLNYLLNHRNCLCLVEFWSRRLRTHTSWTDWVNH